jgi:hypothetical protein
MVYVSFSKKDFYFSQLGTLHSNQLILCVGQLDGLLDWIFGWFEINQCFSVYIKVYVTN